MVEQLAVNLADKLVDKKEKKLVYLWVIEKVDNSVYLMVDKLVESMVIL